MKEDRYDLHMKVKTANWESHSLDSLISPGIKDRIQGIYNFYFEVIINYAFFHFQCKVEFLFGNIIFAFQPQHSPAETRAWTELVND